MSIAPYTTLPPPSKPPSMPSDNTNRFASRKYSICLFVLGVATLFTACGIMTAAEWITSVTLGAGIYGTSNVMDKKNGGLG